MMSPTLQCTPIPHPYSAPLSATINSKMFHCCVSTSSQMQNLVVRLHTQYTAMLSRSHVTSCTVVVGHQLQDGNSWPRRVNQSVSQCQIWCCLTTSRTTNRSGSICRSMWRQRQSVLNLVVRFILTRDKDQTLCRRLLFPVTSMFGRRTQCVPFRSRQRPHRNASHQNHQACLFKVILLLIITLFINCCLFCGCPTVNISIEMRFNV